MLLANPDQKSYAYDSPDANVVSNDKMGQELNATLKFSAIVVNKLQYAMEDQDLCTGLEFDKSFQRGL